jgi:hypothetical protein
LVWTSPSWVFALLHGLANRFVIFSSLCDHLFLSTYWCS